VSFKALLSHTGEFEDAFAVVCAKIAELIKNKVTMRLYKCFME
jgi:hypothetical protein